MFRYPYIYMLIYTCLYIYICTCVYISICISVGHIVEGSPYSTDHQYRCLRKKQSPDIPADEGPTTPAPHSSMFRGCAGVEFFCEKKKKKNSHPRERGPMFSSTLRCGGSGGAWLVHMGHFVDDCFFFFSQTPDSGSSLGVAKLESLADAGCA